MDAQKLNPPVPFPPTPRRLRAKPTGWNGRILAIIFGSFAVAAVASLAVVPVRWYVQSHGTPVRVTVDHKTVSHSNRGGDSYTVYFTYSLEGRTISDSQSTNSREYARLKRGTVGNGHAARILGFNFCLSDLGDIDGETHVWIFTTLMWNAMAWLFIGWGVATVLSARRLVQNGTAAAGTITNQWISQVKSTSWYVNYHFTTDTGESFDQQMRVSRAGYKAVTVGSAVTVLYDPTNAKKSIVYECCNYEVI